MDVVELAVSILVAEAVETRRAYALLSRHRIEIAANPRQPMHAADGDGHRLRGGGLSFLRRKGQTVKRAVLVGCEQAAGTVGRERITHTFRVPTQYIVTLEHPALDGADLSSLEVMLSAGSPLRIDTKKQVIARMGPGIHELYG